MESCIAPQVPDPSAWHTYQPSSSPTRARSRPTRQPARRLPRAITRTTLSRRPSTLTRASTLGRPAVPEPTEQAEQPTDAVAGDPRPQVDWVKVYAPRRRAAAAGHLPLENLSMRRPARSRDDRPPLRPAVRTVRPAHELDVHGRRHPSGLPHPYQVNLGSLPYALTLPDRRDQRGGQRLVGGRLDWRATGTAGLTRDVTAPSGRSARSVPRPPWAAWSSAPQPRQYLARPRRETSP